MSELMSDQTSIINKLYDPDITDQPLASVQVSESDCPRSQIDHNVKVLTGAPVHRTLSRQGSHGPSLSVSRSLISQDINSHRFCSLASKRQLWNW
jgi:hypothetical protein